MYDRGFFLKYLHVVEVFKNWPAESQDPTGKCGGANGHGS